ncbi:MAG: hypothetical protein O9353_06340, partial [Bacteroidia bacterium]|nr:hypothetical protein [Bacteroidia bacterium]
YSKNRRSKKRRFFYACIHSKIRCPLEAFTGRQSDGSSLKNLDSIKSTIFAIFFLFCYDFNKESLEMPLKIS